MKRTKLSASVPGSIPPSSTWYEVPRCFACDDPIKSHRFSTSLLLGKTQYSHSSIPGKLGEYIGDGFVIVVTSQDTLCRNCMNLLNTMDRLEEELKDHKIRLVGNLRRKYGLDPGGQNVVKPIRKHTAADEDDDIIEIQSDEEWTPYNKKRKVTPANASRPKALSCNVCKMEFTELNRYMAHIQQHKELRDRVATPKETVIMADTPKSFKCGCCNLSFDKKETLAAHMRLHTGEKQLNRPVSVISQGDPVSILKNKIPLSSNNGNKLFPKPTSQTVVEMKLIMGIGQTTASSVPTRQPLEKPVTVTKVTEKDPSGKVCLLALWNNGSCTDHADCQDPACGSENNLTNAAITSQQIPQVAQREMFIPRLVMKQAQDSVAEVVVSQADINMSNVLSQPQFQITTAVDMQRNLSNVSSISQGNTHIVAIPHSVHSPAQVPVNIRGSSDQPVSQIVISVPNQTSVNYNTSSPHTGSVVTKEHTVNLGSSANEEVILNTSDNVMPRTLMETVQIPDIDQKSEILSSLSQPSTASYQGQLSDISLGEKPVPAVTEQTNSSSESGKGNKSMPSLDVDIVKPVITERTIVEQDEMGNIAIVNVNSVGESETAYNPKDETDWFLASEQSNAALEPPHTLWGNHETLNSGLATIDQVDGMRSASALPFEAREQNDSVDEDERSEYFTSRYIVDSEKMRQEAEALADAIFAAMKT